MSIRNRIMLGACMALALGGSLIGGSYLSSGGGSAAQAAPIPMKRFSVTCATSGFDGRYFTKQVDPIKSFGQPVSAHRHNFFGALLNGVISPSYSAATYPLRAGHEDDAGYQPVFSNCGMYQYWPLGWYPTALLNGTETVPALLIDTWQAPVGKTVIPTPFGASLLTGNASASQPEPRVRFTCGGNTDGLGGGIDGPGSPLPTDCSNVPGGVVTGELTFPNCWDGLGASRPDPLKQWVFDAPYGIGTNHFYYADASGNCPPGTTPCVPGKLMAQLVTQETWIDNRQTIAGVANPDYNKPLRNPLNPDGSMALSFSSGGAFSFHGDYIETQGQTYQNGEVSTCLNGTTLCPFGTKIGLHNLV